MAVFDDSVFETWDTSEASAGVNQGLDEPGFDGTDGIELVEPRGEEGLVGVDVVERQEDGAAG